MSNSRTRLTERERFSYYLRTGRILADEPEDTGTLAPLETKFNPWHDPRNGRFTFAPGGARTVAARAYGANTGRSTIEGRRISVPIPPAKPVDVVPTIHHPDGSITVKIPPATRRPERSYVLKSNSIAIHSTIEDKVDAVGAEFRRRTGKSMVVTSGTRTAHEQADAMYKKFAAGASGSDYKNRTALRPIQEAYSSGHQTGRSSAETVSDMEAIISRQMQSGVYISRHLIHSAIDIRIRDLSASEQRILRDAVHKGRYGSF